MPAERMALSGLTSLIILIACNLGIDIINKAGTEKYFATSLAMENVASVPCGSLQIVR